MYRPFKEGQIQMAEQYVRSSISLVIREMQKWQWYSYLIRARTSNTAMWRCGYTARLIPSCWEDKLVSSFWRVWGQTGFLTYRSTAIFYLVKLSPTILRLSPTGTHSQSQKRAWVFSTALFGTPGNWRQLRVTITREMNEMWRIYDGIPHNCQKKWIRLTSSNISSFKSSTDRKKKKRTRIYNTIYIYYKIHSCKPVFFKDTHTSEVTLNARGETKRIEGVLVWPDNGMCHAEENDSVIHLCAPDQGGRGENQLKSGLACCLWLWNVGRVKG